MKAVLLFIIGAFALQVSAQVRVPGYHRSDGPYVIPYYRSYSDGYVYDNWRYENVRKENVRRSAPYNNTYVKRTAIRENSARRATINNIKHSAIKDKNIRRSTIRSTYSYPSNSYTYPAYNSAYTYINNSYSSSKYYVTSNFLNVRSGTSSKYTLTGTVYFGESVNVIEVYSNGWMQIQYSAYDNFSSSYVNKYGYVAGNYLSPINPRERTTYTYNTYDKYDSNVYSSIRRDYDYGTGGLCVWTNCGTDGDINIYIDDVYVGTLRDYFIDGIPKIGEEGTLLIEKPAGRYKLVAKGDNYTWSGTVQITKNKCLIQGLER